MKMITRKMRILMGLCCTIATAVALVVFYKKADGLGDVKEIEPLVFWSTTDREIWEVAAKLPFCSDMDELLSMANTFHSIHDGTLDFSTVKVQGPLERDGKVNHSTALQSVNRDDGGVKEITSLVFRKVDNETLNEDIVASIDQSKGTVMASKHFDMDLGRLVPHIEVSKGATYELLSVAKETAYQVGVPVDLNAPVNINVKAADGSVGKYVLTMDFISETEKEALIAIYQANPSNTLGWDLDQDIGMWEGVVVDPSSGRVKALNLNSKGLTVIPSEIGNLSGLNVLDLGSNRLTGLPSGIGRLSRLESLFLDRNRLADIPLEIGRLAELNLLHLLENQLTGIPQEIGGLVELDLLVLNDNPLLCVPPGVLTLGSQGAFVSIDEGVTACAVDEH